MLVGDVDQLAQHGDFQLELDAVERGLEGGLVDVKVHKLDDHQCDIHQDTGHVDRDQLDDGLATAAVAIQLEHAICLPNIESRNDHLLHAESRQLQLLHDIVASDRGVGVRVVGHVGENGGRDMQQEDVHNDHALDEA